MARDTSRAVLDGRLIESEETMIPLTFEHDYVVCDRDEWIDDRTDEHSEAQEAFDAFLESGDFYSESEAVEAWLESLEAVGLYGEGKPSSVCTYNEDNFLSDDMIMTLAHTEAYGSLFIWQHGIWTRSRVNVLAFTGYDDADAYAWASGYASCPCKAEWIIESACILWRNGGGESHKIHDLETDDDGNALCPKCKGRLEFSAS